MEGKDARNLQKKNLWRQIYLGLDSQTQEVVSAVMTTNHVQDFEVFERLLSQVKEGASIVFVLTREGAVFSKKDCLKKRNEALEWIQEKGLLD